MVPLPIRFDVPRTNPTLLYFRSDISDDIFDSTDLFTII